MELVRAVTASGDADRAQALARTITNPWARQIALANLVRAVGPADLDRVRALARQAEAAARSIGTPGNSRALVLTDLVMAMATAGNLEGAEALANTIAEPDRRRKRWPAWPHRPNRVAPGR